MSAPTLFGFVQNPVLSTSFFQDLLNGASKSNSLLYTDEHRLQYQLPLNKSFALSFGVFNNNFLHSKIDYDVIGLLAFGNTVYKGETAYISNTSLTYFTQTGFSIGAIKLLNFKRIQLLIKPSLNIFQSSSFATLRAINSTLFTEENAEYLSLAYNYDYAIQNSSELFAGTGFSGDLLFEMQFSKGNSTIEFGVKDFGTTFYNNPNFTVAENRGDLTYSGVNLDYDEISNLGGRNINSETDSLINILAPINMGNSMSFNQPFRFVFNASLMAGEKDRFRLNMFYIPKYAFEPVFTVMYTRYLGARFNTGVNIGNGAYGGLSSGINIGYNSKRISFDLTVNGLFQLSNGIYAQSGGFLKFAYKLE
jgi:hypothetical protein